MTRLRSDDRRTAAHALASAVTIFLLAASVMTTRSLDRFFWSLPHIVANVSQLVLLTLATLRTPRDVDQGGRAFLYGVLGTVSPVAIAWFGPWLPFGQIERGLADAGRYLNVLIIPFYLAAMWTLGRNLTVLPEASTLRTGGMYSISRHPLYATYLYWYAVQNLIFQSWGALALSAAQIVLTVGRARLEERILARNFAEYEAYTQRVLWFGRSNWFRRRRRAEPADVG
jgi:protein-S-isoprenylcysteine O-methyltransferase Ste14